ncbi:hypothetical protein MtrunA17_Chr3g0097751 [Medicago truncatula]|uniref:Transmembrane protein n=1 Tax=Medicago truncatula TaxID=3880 RepID=A0A396IRJ1_MEDTR|nr:hypothetical protein MtrunA17_Chr3g0097751 [Medicago truncatula]
MVSFYHVVSLLDYFSSYSLSKKHPKALALILLATLWKIWEKSLHQVKNDFCSNSSSYMIHIIELLIIVMKWIEVIIKFYNAGI